MNISQRSSAELQDAAGARRRGGHGAKSATQRDRVLLSLLAGYSIAQSARRARVGERTVRDWLSQPSFRGELDARRRQVFQQSLDQIQALAARAADALGDLLSARQPSTVRLATCRVVLETGLNERSAKELLARLNVLEESLSVSRQESRR